MVQVLTDMNLGVRRAYISSDGEWFMDGTVFSIFYLPCLCELCFQFLGYCFMWFFVTGQFFMSRIKMGKSLSKMM